MVLGSIKTALVLAPHTDDGELGCGATIAKLIDEGCAVYYAAFSTADTSVSPEFPPNQLAKEVKHATAELGIPQENLIIYNYEVRKLNYVRQEVLEELILLRDKINPQLVFMPSSEDIHQDHQTIFNEGLRAFKFSSILGYELIWNNRSFSTDCFVRVNASHVGRKVKALHMYETQHGKSYMDPDFIRSLAKVRGTQIGSEYAEAFEVIRLVV